MLFRPSRAIAALCTLAMGLVPAMADSPLSPTSRYVKPVSVFRTTGNVTIAGAGAASPSSPASSSFILSGPNTTITFDMGKITAGQPLLRYGPHSACNGFFGCTRDNLPDFICLPFLCQALGMSFSETAEFVGVESDPSLINRNRDSTLFVPIRTEGVYQLPSKFERGAFRYLTLSLSDVTPAKTHVQVSLETVFFTPDPDVADSALQQTTGSFSSSDPLLSSIWNAGVYTLQLCTIRANSSNDPYRILTPGAWSTNAQVTGFQPLTAAVSVDGAKRDRNPWAGDIDVSSKSTMVSRSNDPIKRTISAIFSEQDRISGFFPYVGPPFARALSVTKFIKLGTISDTYHLWAIISFAEFVLNTGDRAFGKELWSQAVQGLKAVDQYIDRSTGLYNGQRNADWGRNGQKGMSTSLNALYYRSLTQMSQTAGLLGRDAQQASAWATQAATLKKSINANLFGDSLYFDNTSPEGRLLFPQDGNVLAIDFNVTDSDAKTSQIARELQKRWNQFGAVSTELPGTISPFVSSQELRAQFKASELNQDGDASDAYRLMRTMWGYMLDAFSHSTFVEGYSSNGTLSYLIYVGDRSAFISNAHAWSTGPVFNLINNVVGLQVAATNVRPEDGDWAFKPAVLGSGLQNAQGGFSLAGKTYRADWKTDNATFEASVTFPLGTIGTMYVPTLSSTEVPVTLNGQVQTQGRFANGYVRLGGVRGGTYTIGLQRP